MDNQKSNFLSVVIKYEAMKIPVISSRQFMDLFGITPQTPLEVKAVLNVLKVGDVVQVYTKDNGDVCAAFYERATVVPNGTLCARKLMARQSPGLRLQPQEIQWLKRWLETPQAEHSFTPLTGLELMYVQFEHGGGCVVKAYETVDIVHPTDIENLRRLGQ